MELDFRDGELADAVRSCPEADGGVRGREPELERFLLSSQ